MKSFKASRIWISDFDKSSRFFQKNLQTFIEKLIFPNPLKKCELKMWISDIINLILGNLKFP